MRCPYENVITSDTSSENWSAAVWDPKTGSLLSNFKQASSLAYHTLQLLSDSYLIAADNLKPRLHLWPLNSQVPVQNLRLATPGKVNALACTPNGSYIAAAINEKIYIWQTCSGRLINSFAKHYQTITCLIFNKDGSCLASGAEDSLIFVWSTSQILIEKEDKPVCSFNHHSLPVKDLYFGQTGGFGRLCSVSLDRTARIYDVHQGLLLLTLIFDVPLTTVCMDILENDLYVGTSTGIIIQSNLRDPPRGLESHITLSEDNEKNNIFKSHTDSIVTISVSVDCITLLSGSKDGFVYLWDIPSKQIVKTLQHKSAITSAFFAQAYDNFTTKNFKPTVNIRSLQKVSDIEETEDYLEIIRKDEDDSWLTNDEFVLEDSYINVESNTDCKNKLLEACNEIERLKNINSQLYQYSIKNIFDKNTSEKDNSEDD